jgi:hypothetical protein
MKLLIVMNDLRMFILEDQYEVSGREYGKNKFLLTLWERLWSHVLYTQNWRKRGDRTSDFRSRVLKKRETLGIFMLLIKVMF